METEIGSNDSTHLTDLKTDGLLLQGRKEFSSFKMAQVSSVFSAPGILRIEQSHFPKILSPSDFFEDFLAPLANLPDLFQCRLFRNEE